MHGDIVDCVEIKKQLAFDHPLLKNHSLQMKPNFKVSMQRSTPSSSLVLTPSQLLPESMRCPKGTVPIKRIKEEDLAMEKFSPSFGTAFTTANSSIIIDSSDGLTSVPQYASLVSLTNNEGASGNINVWNPEVATDQLSAAFVDVASDDGSLTNYISAGWADLNTKNWWLFYGDEQVGYWPKELFSTLTNGAQRAGWGGEISSPETEAAPAMGSGHFPEEGQSKASMIYGLTLYGAKGVPKKTDMQLALTKPDCYKAIDAGDSGGAFGYYMFFGGPPNCKL
ncbi:POU domain class 2 transcription factor 1 [Bienertia sinuspersici]